ncbi:MAG: VCBS repeat-containing protein [Burkholderiaceae bacterium]
MSTLFSAVPALLRYPLKTVWCCLLYAQFLCNTNASAMGLMVEPAPVQCGIPSSAQPVPPVATAQRLSGSQVVRGSKDVAWAWLGSPTVRYPHRALGSPVHAGSLHALVRTASDTLHEVIYRLPVQRVFEDLTVRLIDLDGDGRDEMVVVESDALRGSAIVVLGLRSQPQINRSSNPANAMVLTELARSPHTGGTFYWLNPIGAADFDGDGKLDMASVTTPHVGGVLTLYHYRPPLLEPYAKAMDVSNHRMGDPEQDLAVIVELPGLRPTVVVPDMTLTALHALRWEKSDLQTSSGRWKELADVMALPARVQRMTPMPGGACVLLADGSWRRVRLQH